MSRVTTAGAKAGLSALISKLPESGPITIMRHSKAAAVLIDPTEYERLQWLQSLVQQRTIRETAR